jgi:hypothetical protein
MIKKIKEWLEYIVMFVLMAPIIILASWANHRSLKKRRKREEAKRKAKERKARK